MTVSAETTGMPPTPQFILLLDTILLEHKLNFVLHLRTSSFIYKITKVLIFLSTYLTINEGVRV